MKSSQTLLSVFFLSLLAFTWAPAQKAELLEVQKIWDKAPHNAFTDLIYYQNVWYCCFREGQGHVGGDGLIRILISSTGKNWVDYAQISLPGTDLRDPKLEIMPDGKRLYLIMGGSVYQGNTLVGRRPHYSTSQDGKTWTPPQKILAEGDWLWRVTTHPDNGKMYGVTYHTAPVEGGVTPEAEWSAKMYSSTDGSVWQLESLLNVTGRPNETTVRFLQNGKAMALVRREADDRKGMIGLADAPYRQWSWTPLPSPLGGPNFIQLPDGTLIAGSRGFGATPGPHMVLFKITESGWEPLLELPSAGDCSYPGLVWQDNILWVSYYSTHENNQSSIYLARVKLTP